MRRSTASVKAPRSWPKSSLSISVSGIAAQLTANGDEGPLAARAEVVDGVRGELLAGPALAADQHGGSGDGDAAEGVEDFLHGLAATQQIPEALLPLDARAQSRDLVLESPPLEQLTDLDAQGLHLEGFGDVVRRSALHGLDGAGDGLGCSEDHDRRRDRLLGDLLEQGQSAAAGHDEVEQDQVRRSFGDRAQRLVDAPGGRHLAVVLEEHPQRCLHSGLVVDHEDAGHCGGNVPNANGSSGADAGGRLTPAGRGR
jgi:hypothetical protein